MPERAEVVDGPAHADATIDDHRIEVSGRNPAIEDQHRLSSCGDVRGRPGTFARTDQDDALYAQVLEALSKLDLSLDVSLGAHGDQVHPLAPDGLPGIGELSLNDSPLQRTLERILELREER